MLVNKLSYKIIVFLFNLSILAVKCEEYQSRTTAGEEVDIKKVPYTVCTSIGCTGALVKPQWVLSAAHCFLDLDLKSMSIGLGATDWKTSHYNIRIEKVYLHPKYKKNSHTIVRVLYDIAVIKLAVPAELSESVQLLQLEETEWPAVDKRECTLAGFGHNIYKNTKLHMSKYNFTQGCSCIQDKKIICYTSPKDGGDAPCYGDSGSVIVCDNKGVAVMSHFLSIGFCASWNTRATGSSTVEECKNSFHFFSHMQPHLEWFKDVVLREPDTYLHSKASTLTIKGIEYYSVITTSVQLFAMLIIFFSYFRL